MCLLLLEIPHLSSSLSLLTGHFELLSLLCFAAGSRLSMADLWFVLWPQKLRVLVWASRIPVLLVSRAYAYSRCLLRWCWPGLLLARNVWRFLARPLPSSLMWDFLARFFLPVHFSRILCGGRAWRKTSFSSWRGHVWRGYHAPVCFGNCVRLYFPGWCVLAMSF